MRQGLAVLVSCLSAGLAFAGTSARLTFSSATPPMTEWKIDARGNGTFKEVPFDRVNGMVLRGDLAWNVTKVTALLISGSSLKCKLGTGETPKQVVIQFGTREVDLSLESVGPRLRWIASGVPVRFLCDPKGAPGDCGKPQTGKEVGIPAEFFGEVTEVRIMGNRGGTAVCTPAEVQDITITTSN